jgi:hypothetical protein
MEHLPQLFGIMQHDLVEHADAHWHHLMVHDDNRWLSGMLVQLLAQPGQLGAPEVATITMHIE